MDSIQKGWNLNIYAWVRSKSNVRVPANYSGKTGAFFNLYNNSLTVTTEFGHSQTKLNIIYNITCGEIYMK